MFENLATPALLVDLEKLERNIAQMQSHCDAHGVELRPHLKTHKMIEVARRQVEAGAAGITCAKLSEAEVLVASGAKSVFIAHSLVDPLMIPRLRALHSKVDELILACTSIAHAPVLEKLLAAADLQLPVMLAIDTGMGREGARDEAEAMELARFIHAAPHLKLHGIYTHEGQFYLSPPVERKAGLQALHARMLALRKRIEDDLKIETLRFWPGCSATARDFSQLPDVQAVRPGAYVFGDLVLTDFAEAMTWGEVALTVLATVIDKPEPGLALIDAGSKTFSGDKTSGGLSGRAYDGRDLRVVRCNEEHGYLHGADVDALQLGERVRFVPAHICPVVNLADEVQVISGDQIVATWRVEARGCNT